MRVTDHNRRSIGATSPRGAQPQVPTLVPGIGRLAIVDDHRFVAETLATLLAHMGIDADVVPVDSLSGIEGRLAALRPSVVLLDFHLGELGPATPLIRPLVRGGIAVVVVTGDPDPLTKARCLEAGAAAVLTKGTGIEAVLAILDGVVSGVRLVADDERSALLSTLRRDRTRRRGMTVRFERLTRREANVLRLICDGLSAGEIAESSFVSLATVRTQIRSILTKLEVNSQIAAVALAHRAGWVDGPGRKSSIVAMTGTA